MHLSGRPDTSLAQGARVAAALGDGTFGFLPMELDTAVRAGASFVAVVENDAAWNAELQVSL